MDMIGDITIEQSDERISAVYWGRVEARGREMQTPLLAEAFSQLREYLDGKRRDFSVPLALKGTPFQVSVYEALRAIPYGKTASYEDIAIAVGRPLACRAVGQANHRNPIPLFVPCHRVVNKNGGLGGFAPGLDFKRDLLALEKRNAVN
jgi:methylated-DNA-[protein]-cysteine S-methyltransferase